MRRFGLIGFPLQHSFSPSYFRKKFESEGLTDCQYEAFELPDIAKFDELVERDHPELEGLNVTTPYKKNIIPFLAQLDPLAQRLGAVNTVKRIPNGWKGYNTDYAGFRKSLAPFLSSAHERALILGSGGASLAVAAVLEDLGIPFLKVSRRPLGRNEISYEMLNPELLRHHQLIVNTTPLGTWPDVELCPPIPYEYIGSGHFLYDLVYNPEKTQFMEQGLGRGAMVCNGYNMLAIQAEKSWEVWNQ